MSETPSPKQTSTFNRFSELPIDLTEDNNTEIQAKKIYKPPPIILYGIDEVSKLTELLATDYCCILSTKIKYNSPTKLPIETN